jgi:hypothetical protein
VKAFIDVMAISGTLDPSEVVFQKLQHVCGRDSDDLIDDQRVTFMRDCLDKVKRAVEDAPGTFKNCLLGEIRLVFGIEGDTYDDCRAGISKWFNSLDEYQKDLSGKWHTNESQALMRNLGRITDIETTLFVLVPKDLGLGQVADWTTDKTKDYIVKLSEGLKHVEANAIKVDSPLVSCLVPGLDLKGQDGKWQVQYSNSASIKIDVPKDGVTVLMSDSGEDPTSAVAQVQRITSSFEYTVNGGNKTVLLVSCDEQGNFGRNCSVEFVDEGKKNVIEPPTPKPLPGMDQIVRFVLPTDPAAFETSVSSLVDTSIRGKAVDRQQAAAVLRKIADRQEGQSGQ